MTALFCRNCGVKLVEGESKISQEKRNEVPPSRVHHVKARCRETHQPFLISFVEDGPRRWVASSSRSVAEGEVGGYAPAADVMRGKLSVGSEYKCPLCRARSISKCNGCEGVSCYSGTTKEVTCPWCASRGRIEGSIEQLKTVSRPPLR